MTTPVPVAAIDIVFASDANYVMPLAVAMCSTAVNSSVNRSLRFHVLQSGIGPELRAKVERSVKRAASRHTEIHWLDTPMHRIAGFKVNHAHLSALTFARLLIPDLLPASVDKALYLDADIVVNEDVGELWDRDLGGRSIWAARDAIGFVSRPGGISNFRELGIPENAHYFNAGVLLINVAKWRMEDTGHRLLDYLEVHRDIVQWVDQEALNAVLWNDWGELEYRWNSQIAWRRYRQGIAVPNWTPDYSRRSIVHFATSEKPWLPGCDYGEKQYFFEYLDRTEWQGWRVPVWKDGLARARRATGDLRDSLGVWRRRLTGRLSVQR